MYLPVYLAKDFGALSFLVFAIPNIIGAAAVPFLLRSAPAVRTFALRHLEAIRAFAFATILFHIVFLSGFMPTGILGLDLGVGGITVVMALLVGVSSRPRATTMAVGVWALSLILALCAILAARKGLYYSMPPVHGTYSLLQLAMASPAIIIGFLLCPLLDGTFLATREFHGLRTERIFLLAFLALFPALILITLGYAGRILTNHALSYFLFVHLALQSGFTIGVQWWALRWLRTLRAERPAEAVAAIDGAHRWGGRILLAAVGLSFGAAMFAQNFGVSLHADLSPQRLAYDLMLSLYGLVFPAYLMAIAVPPLIGRRGCAWVFLGALAVAGPLYWIAAMDHRYWAMPIAVGALLIAPVLTPSAREKNREIA